MLILISDAFDASLPGKLERFGEVTTDTERLSEAEAVLVRSKTKCTKEYIDSAPKLKLILRGGVGTDNIDKEYAKEKGITVRNTPKASSIAVAELTFAMMIAVPCRIVEAHNSMAAGEWKKKELKRTELYGKTLCIVGLGNIGNELARRASAFGMKVQAYDPYVKSSSTAELKPSLEEAVKDADYITLHVPLVDETRGMINKKIISGCEKTPVFINAGRGPCVDAEDMAAALKEGSVAAYATDVWPSDPPEKDYPILSAPNTLMLPHIAASTRENLLRIGDEAVEILDELVKGGVL
ncbi:MAG: NAD(P)-dependent oxidoreductase [Spirochaetaceae bacterium]